MTHPIIERVEGFRSQVRRWAFYRSVGFTVSASLVAAVFLIAIDYIFRLESVLLRSLLTATWLIGTVYLSFRGPYTLARTQWPLATVAQTIETQYPHLRDRLSSTLAFLSPEDAEASLGSPQLMRNVINETARELGDIPLQDVLDSSKMRRTLLLCLGTLLVCLLLFFSARDVSFQGVSRLLSPWRSNPWPRLNHLLFAQLPARVVQGSDLVVNVVDKNGRLPESIRLFVTTADVGQQGAEGILMRIEGNRATLEKKGIRKPIRLRASGGDDDTMAWSTVGVVPPPRIVSSVTSLVPPDYTGWQPTTLPDIPVSLRLLEGTQITLTGQVDRPIRYAHLEIHATQQSFEAPSLAPLTFRVPDTPERWQVDASSRFSLNFGGVDGSLSPDPDPRHIQVIIDEDPTVSLLSPPEDILVTSRTILPVTGRIEDDLGIQRIELRLQRSDRPEDVVTKEILYARAAALPREMPPLPPPTDKQEIRHLYPLESRGLQPGATVSVYLVAIDSKGQQSTTAERRLTVVTEPKLLQSIARRQSALLKQLEPLLSQQRAAREQVERLRHVTTAGELPVDLENRLQAAIFQQRQVNRSIRTGEQNISQQAARLEAALNRSQIGDIEIRRQIESTNETLQELYEAHLVPALQTTSVALQSIQLAADGAVSVADLDEQLAVTVTEQSRAISAIEELLGRLSIWNNYQEFSHEISELLERQRDIIAATKRARAATLQPGASQQAPALPNSVSAQQMDIARRTDRVLDKFDSSAKQLAVTEPQAARRLKSSAEIARHEALSGTMREAGRRILRHQFGMAINQQERSEEILERILSSLSQQALSPQERSNLLSVASQELHQLQADHSRRMKALPDGRSASTEWLEQQAAASESMRKLQPMLHQLEAVESERHLDQAARSATQSLDAARKGATLQARESLDQTEASLARASDQLHRTLQHSRTMINHAKFVKLPGQIAELAERQRRVVEAIRAVNHQGTDLIARQSSIAETARSLAEDLTDLPTYGYGLKRSVESMDAAVTRLATGKDDQAATAATAAADQLDAMLDVLTARADKDENRPQKGDATGMAPKAPRRQTDPAGEVVISQLKMVKLLQQQINDRTEILASRADESVDQRQQLRELAQQQQEVETLLAKLGTEAQQLLRKQTDSLSENALPQELEQQ